MLVLSKFLILIQILFFTMKTNLDGNLSQYLMQVSISFLNDSECVNIDPEVNPAIAVCAGEPGKTICNVS